MRWGLLILLAAGLFGACRPLATGPARTGGTGSGAGAGTSSNATALVGTWRRTLVLETSADITVSETTWLFGGDGVCERTVATTSVAADITQTTRTTCRWSTNGTTVAIRYDGAGTAQFTWSVQGTTLLLNGQAFQRA